MGGYDALKEGGFMRQVQPENYALRLRVVAGQLTTEKLKKIHEVADKYGAGYVHLTSRQGLEIPFIKLADVEAVKAELAVAGIEPGSCGPRVRTVTACQGNEICPSGLIDTTKIANEVDARYFNQRLPHKFKVGITGCRNNCLKAEENDLGIKGGLEPTWHKAECSFCGLCEQVCPAKAIQVATEEVTLDQAKCTYCGKCVKSCPTDAWSGENGYILYFGGTFGNRILVGKQAMPLLKDENELFNIIDKTIAFYKENAKEGERLGYCLERVGFGVLADYLKDGGE